MTTVRQTRRVARPDTTPSAAHANDYVQARWLIDAMISALSSRLHVQPDVAGRGRLLAALHREQEAKRLLTPADRATVTRVLRSYPRRLRSLRAGGTSGTAA